MMAFIHQFNLYTYPLPVDLGLVVKDMWRTKGKGCRCKRSPLTICRMCLMEVFPDIKPLVGLPFRSMLFSTSPAGCVVKALAPSSPLILKDALGRWCRSLPRRWLDGVAGLEVFVNVDRDDVDALLAVLRGMPSSCLSANCLFEKPPLKRPGIRALYYGRLMAASFPIPDGYEVWLKAYWVSATPEWLLKLEFQLVRAGGTLLSVPEARIIARHLGLLLHGLCQMAGVGTLPLYSDSSRSQEGEALALSGSGSPVGSGYGIMASLFAEAVSGKAAVGQDLCRNAVIMASGRPVNGARRLRQHLALAGFELVEGCRGRYELTVRLDEVLRLAGAHDGMKKAPVRSLVEFHGMLKEKGEVIRGKH